MRRVRAAGGVVHEPRLGRVLRPDAVQPLDRLVGQVVREVVLLAVPALRDPEHRVVLGDDRVVLACCPGQEPPEVVEAPRLRPVAERARRALHVVGCQMPLAEPAGDVAVLLQNARQRGAAAGPRRGIAGERARVLGDGTEAHPVMVTASQQSRAGRRAERGHMEAVVRQPHVPHPRHGRGRDRAAERIGVTEPGVVDQHNQHVRGVLGRLRPGDHRPVRNRLADRAPHRPAEAAVGDRQHRAVRAELARCLRQGGLQLPQALLAHRGDRLRQRTGQCPLGGQPVIAVDHRDDDRGARGELVTKALLDAAVDLVLSELADQAAHRAADGNRCEQRRREQAHHQADATAPPQALAAQVVAGLGQLHLAVGVMLDQDHALRPDRFVLDQPHKRVKVLLGQPSGRVRSHDHIEGIPHCLSSHRFESRCPAVRRL